MPVISFAAPGETPRENGIPMAAASFKRIIVGDGELAFNDGGRRHAFPRVALPAAFMEWMVAARRSMFEDLKGHGTAEFFAAHLPVVVTWRRHQPIPFNTGNKGVGLVPVAGKLGHYADLYEECFDQTRAAPREESLPLRLDVVRRFVTGDDVSDRALITLEIFEKQTFANLSDLPVATLHYTDVGPVYRSFQIDTVVEILTPEHPAYRFAFLSRQLFEQDAFHITQTEFPFAYLFHPTRVRDKTPYRRRPGR